MAATKSWLLSWRLCACILLSFLSPKAVVALLRPIALAPPTDLRRTRAAASRDATHRRDATTRWARKSAPEAEASTDRRSILALAIPVGFGLASQAPLLGLIANPPDAIARESMLESWCAADYCTLLGGGAGYATSYASFPGNYVEPEGGPPGNDVGPGGGPPGE
mmetsp:Transcript_26622/g.79839  ORF Transcript_26622/g.79839 Transcript_26622/m.79839 type:complete len:165 (-) Transcript_26622:24-518(-)